MENKIKLNWEYKPGYKAWEALVPAQDSKNKGYFHIWIEPRPLYCDRGNFVANVMVVDLFPLDDYEGFPRYYFELETAKKEMEFWVNKREECKAALFI